MEGYNVPNNVPHNLPCDRPVLTGTVRNEKEKYSDGYEIQKKRQRKRLSATAKLRRRIAMLKEAASQVPAGGERASSSCSNRNYYETQGGNIPAGRNGQAGSYSSAVVRPSVSSTPHVGMVSNQAQGRMEYHENTNNLKNLEKRRRSLDSSDSINWHKKKQKFNDPKRDYCNAAPSHLKAAVIDRTNPLGKLNADKVSLVRAALRAELRQAALEGKRVATFESISYSGETLRITCDTEVDLEWLKATVARLAPWEDAKLHVIRADRLPRLTKFRVWIRADPDEGLEHKDMVLKMLKHQNRYLDVDQWCLFHHAIDADNQGQIFVFGIGEEDTKKLKEKQCRLSYYYHSLKAVMHERKTPEEKVVKAPVVVVGENKPVEQSASLALNEPRVLETVEFQPRTPESLSWDSISISSPELAEPTMKRESTPPSC